MARKNAEMKAKVEARRKQEAAARAEKGRKPVEVSKIEITNGDLLAYFNESVFGNFSFYSYKKACGQKKTVRGSKNSRRLSNGTPAI